MESLWEVTSFVIEPAPDRQEVLRVDYRNAMNVHHRVERRFRLQQSMVEDDQQHRFSIQEVCALNSWLQVLLSEIDRPKPRHLQNGLGKFVWTGTVLYQLFDGGKVAVMSYACLRAMILKEYAGWLFRLTLHTTAATSAAPPCIQG
jgi:hypothetical protein